MAVYLKEYLEKILNELEQNNQKTKEKVSQFILDNNWFSIKVDSSNWSIDEADAAKLGQEIKNYLLKDGGVEGIKSIFSSKFPETFNEFQKYIKSAKIDEESQFYIQDFFAYYLEKDLPSMLLTIVTRGKYKELSPSQQTQMIKELNLTPSEIEKTLELSVRANTRATNALKMVVNQGLGTDQLLTICHRIGNGEAFSKQAESMCLLSALGQLCPFDDRHHCVGCQYELQTKSTLLLLIGEFNRLNRRYTEVTSDLEKGKIRSIIEMQIKPCLEDMLQALSEQYGEDVLNDYEEIIKELVS